MAGAAVHPRPPPYGSAPAEVLSKASTRALVCQGNDAHLGCRLIRRIDNPASLTSAIRHGLPAGSCYEYQPFPHSTAQFFEMTDTQIFIFLVMPFLFVLTCSMVFFSSRTPKRREKPADSPEPGTRPNTYIRKPRKGARQPNTLMRQRIRHAWQLAPGSRHCRLHCKGRMPSNRNTCLGSRLCRRWSRTVDDQHQAGRLCPGGYRHRHANRTDDRRAIASSVCQSFQNQLTLLKVFTMRQTKVSTADFSPVAAPTFMALPSDLLPPLLP